MGVFSAKKSNDEKVHLAACGQPSGIINVYEISRDHLEPAQKLGFMDISTLRK